MMQRKVMLPLTDGIVKNFRTGDNLLITGVIYAAKDTAHKRMVEALKRGEILPVNLKGQIIYYVGPSPARPGRPIGSASPTTSGRMDSYTPCLLAKGLKGMIGKGSRSKEVKDAIKKYKAVYFGAIGGAGALLSKCIINVEIIAFKDLGSNALQALEVKEFPVIVINDIYGGDLYEEGKAKYQIKL